MVTLYLNQDVVFSQSCVGVRCEKDVRCRFRAPSMFAASFPTPYGDTALSVERIELLVLSRGVRRPALASIGSESCEAHRTCHEGSDLRSLTR